MGLGILDIGRISLGKNYEIQKVWERFVTSAHLLFRSHKLYPLKLRS